MRAALRVRYDDAARRAIRMTVSPRKPSTAERRVFALLALTYVGMTVAVVPWADLSGPRVPQIIAVSNGGIALVDFCTALVLGREFQRGARPAYLTGVGQQGDLEATRRAGFYAHLTKPAAPEEALRLAAAPADNVVPLSPIDARRAS